MDITFDPSLTNVLRNHENRINKLELIPIGCDLSPPDDCFFVVTDRPPDYEVCGVCYEIIDGDRVSTCEEEVAPCGCDEFDRPDGPLGDQWVAGAGEFLNWGAWPMTINEAAEVEDLGLGHDYFPGSTHDPIGITVTSEGSVGDQSIEVVAANLWQELSDTGNGGLVVETEWYLMCRAKPGTGSFDDDQSCITAYFFPYTGQYIDPLGDRLDRNNLPGTYYFRLELIAPDGTDTTLCEEGVTGVPKWLTNEPVTLRLESYEDGDVRFYIDGQLLCTATVPLEDMPTGDRVGWAPIYYHTNYGGDNDGEGSAVQTLSACANSKRYGSGFLALLGWSNWSSSGVLEPVAQFLNVALWAMVDGGVTQVGSSYSERGVGLTGDRTLRMEVDPGGVVRVYVNGVEVISATDTTVPMGDQQGFEMWWDTQFAFPVPTSITSPQLLQASGGGSEPWSDPFNDLAAWEHPGKIYSRFAGMSQMFSVSDGAAVGADAYGNWDAQGVTTGSTMTRREASPGESQFIEVTVSNLWQPLDVPGINPDANMRGAIYCYTALGSGCPVGETEPAVMGIVEPYRAFRGPRPLPRDLRQLARTH